MSDKGKWNGKRVYVSDDGNYMVMKHPRGWWTYRIDDGNWFAFDGGFDSA